MNKSNIYAGVHYRPIYQNTYFQKLGFKQTNFPNAENYYSNSISLPLYPDISIEQLNYIISKLEEFLEKIMIDIGRKSIGDNAPCYITLEAGPTIDGFESAKKLIEVAAKSKADAIKFQILKCRSISCR